MSCFSVGKSSPWIQKFQELKHPRSSKVTIKYFVRSDRNMQHSIWSIIHAKNAKLESKKVIRSNYHPTRKTGGRVTLEKTKQKKTRGCNQQNPAFGKFYRIHLPFHSIFLTLLPGTFCFFPNMRVPQVFILLKSLYFFFNYTCTAIFLFLSFLPLSILQNPLFSILPKTKVEKHLWRACHSPL